MWCPVPVGCEPGAIKMKAVRPPERIPGPLRRHRGEKTVGFFAIDNLRHEDYTQVPTCRIALK